MNNSMQGPALDNATARREGVKRNGAGRHSVTSTPELRKPSGAVPRLVLGNHHGHIVGKTGFGRLTAISPATLARTSAECCGTPSTSARHAIHSRAIPGQCSSHGSRRALPWVMS